MPVIFMVIATVKDWQSLRKLNEESIVAKASALRAKRCQVYRDPHDASRALLWIELRQADDVTEMRETVVQQLNGLQKVRLLSDQIWEPTGWHEPASERERQTGQTVDGGQEV